MAVSKRKVPATPLGTHLVTDDGVTTTAQALGSGATTIYAVFINNASNSAKSYMKFYNTSSPSAGTTEPYMVLMAPGSGSVQYTFPEGIVLGAASSYRCVTTGGTAGTTSPDQQVSAAMIVDV